MTLHEAAAWLRSCSPTEKCPFTAEHAAAQPCMGFRSAVMTLLEQAALHIAAARLSASQELLSALPGRHPMLQVRMNEVAACMHEADLPVGWDLRREAVEVQGNRGKNANGPMYSQPATHHTLAAHPLCCSTGAHWQAICLSLDEPAAGHGGPGEAVKGANSCGGLGGPQGGHCCNAVARQATQTFAGAAASVLRVQRRPQPAGAC